MLERAELAVLLPQQGVTLPLKEADARAEHKRVELASRPPSAGFDWRRWSRPLLWSSMAAAAALMITLFAPQPGNEQASRMARLERRDSTRILVEAPESDNQPFDTVATDDDSLFGGQPESGDRPLMKKEAAPRGRYAPPRDVAASSRTEMPSIGLNAAPLQTNAPVSLSAEEPLAQNLVVVCEVTSQAAEQNYFARVLERNRVSVDATQRSSGSDAATDADSDTVVRDQQNGYAFESTASPAREAAGAQTQSAERKQTIYVVEASQQQLTNVLADLQGDRTDVLAVNVDPAPQIPAQQALTFFCRGYDSEKPAPRAGSRRRGRFARAAFRLRSPIGAVPAVSPVEQKLTESNTVEAAPKLTPQSPAEAPAVEHPEPILVPETEDLLGRTNPQAWYSRNQLRQQIPVDEQRRLLRELKNLSDPPPPTTAGLAVETPKVESTQRRAMQNSSRARQIELPRLSQINAGVAVEGTSSDRAQILQREQATNRAKSAADTSPKELSGGGSPSKDGEVRRGSRQFSADSLREPPAARSMQSAQQIRPPMPEPPSVAVQQTSEEPLVKAVFVIQAAAGGQTPATSEAGVPSSEASPAETPQP